MGFLEFLAIPYELFERIGLKMKSVVLFLSLLFMLFGVDAIGICPVKCTCRPVTQNGQNMNGLKVKCGGNPLTKLTSIKEIGFDDITRSDIVHL